MQLRRGAPYGAAPPHPLREQVEQPLLHKLALPLSPCVVRQPPRRAQRRAAASVPQARGGGPRALGGGGQVHLLDEGRGVASVLRVPVVHQHSHGVQPAPDLAELEAVRHPQPHRAPKHPRLRRRRAARRLVVLRLANRRWDRRRVQHLPGGGSGRWRKW